VLPSGNDVLAHGRKSGVIFERSFFRLPWGNRGSDKPIFALRGALGAAFLQLSDGLGVSVVMPNVNKVLVWMSSLVKRIQDCRAGTNSEKYFI
jgi:hypothetical protein